MEVHNKIASLVYSIDDAKVIVNWDLLIMIWSKTNSELYMDIDELIYTERTQV